MDEHLHAESYRAFLHILRGARESAGITQEQLALSIGETQSFVSKCERGERRLDIIELFEFCKALDIDTLELVKTIRETIKRGTK